MTKEVRRVSLVVTAMFVSLFVAGTLLQAVNTEALANDPRNVRNIYESYKTQRGPILVDGKPIAESVAVDSAYR
jgi:peptidoglycan glycosyltransferase